jgi:hypothetical protein
LDVLYPAFSLEDQDTAAALMENHVIVGPPSFVSPDNPAAVANSLLPVNQHPDAANLDAGYGDAVATPVDGPLGSLYNVPEE